jgi:hypothetical protein
MDPRAREFLSPTFLLPNAEAAQLPDSAICMATLTRREALTAGVAWAKGLLASKERRNELCKQEFQESDADGGGELDDGEILTTIKRVCDKFQLPLPSDEKCSELFAKCDKNGDGSKLAKTRANHPYSRPVRTIQRPVRTHDSRCHSASTE